jgi:EAL domain-containing protein (putative c-di-GMP-specific phosphodiesterase class I)
MAHDENDAAIVRSTIGLAHDLGLSVVAEGVEDEAAWDMLTDLGCDVAQGYFVSRPLPAGDLTRWLANSRWSPQATIFSPMGHEADPSKSYAA